MLEMAARVFLVLVLVSQVSCEVPYRAGDGFMDRLTNGMKFAKDFLGSEGIALKVAEFVVKAFQPKSSASIRRKPSNEGYDDQNLEDEDNYQSESRPYDKVNEAVNPLSPLRHLVRLFGLQPTQISAVAVNALLFVAQMISTFLSGPQRPGKPHRSEDPLHYMLNKRSSRLQDLIATARNESLPHIIEDIIEQQNTDEDISCVKLLVCKMTPFVVKMQKAVFGQEEVMVETKEVGAAVMWRHLPSTDELTKRSDVCENKHRDCILE